MDILTYLIGDPYDQGGRYWIMYLGLPVVVTALLAVVFRRLPKLAIVFVAPWLAAIIWVALWVWAYGVSSTLGLGFGLALVVYTLASLIVVILTRRILYRLSGPRPA